MNRKWVEINTETEIDQVPCYKFKKKMLRPIFKIRVCLLALSMRVRARVYVRAGLRLHIRICTHTHTHKADSV